MLRLAILAVAFFPVVFSQATSNAECTVTSLSWTSNSLGQSPCDVAADLAAVCNNGVFTLDKLGPGLVYLGPSQPVANSCRCSTVYYSLLSACAACQGNHWIGWTEYSFNCTTSYNAIFPRPLPAGTSVPSWAYTNIAASDNFNLSMAQDLQNLPESTAPPTSGTSSGFPTSGNSASLTASTSVSNDNGSASSHAGAIAGGIIGGGVGLSVAGLFFFFYRRRRRQNTLSTFSALKTTSYTPAPHNDSTLNMSTNPSTNIVSTPSQPQRFYDPSDPSTFPTTPAPLPSSRYNDTHTPSLVSDPFQESALQLAHVPPAQTGLYTGAPEL